MNLKKTIIRKPNEQKNTLRIQLLIFVQKHVKQTKCWKMSRE